jgi:tetratricopeptide (TPR) repeat protein
MNRLESQNSIASQDPALARLVEEAAGRLLRGEPVDAEALAAEHPEYADELRALLPAVLAMRDFSRSGDSVPWGPGDADPQGTLGDYRIRREVGRGGMGVVYEAEQMSLRRRVALKVLPWAAAMDPKQLQRFKNEALAAAGLKHEHIVSVYAVGCERGVHFYAMEFVEGLTLAQVIAAMRDGGAGKAAEPDRTAAYIPADRVAATGKDPPAPSAADTAPLAALSTQRGPKGREFYRTAAGLMAQAADALEHAHSLGIVHRDVKPGNLMVDEAGKLWVTDFGLARFGPDAGLTLSGDLLGTLRYMAPEQALARHGLVDHRADVYGLGATLYELLTGRPVVDATERVEMLRQIAFEEPAAPCKLDRAIAAELETITLKCLAKNPAERYATAGELADDLCLWLEHKTIKAKPPSLRQKAAKWARRHRPVVWATLVCLAVTATVLASGIGWVAGDLVARRTRAEERVRETVEQAEVLLADGNPYAPDLVRAVRQAEVELDSGLVRERLRQRVEQVQSDLAMLAGLEQSRLRLAEVKDGHFDRGGAAADYARAFQKFGIDMETLDVEAAARVQESTIAVHLAAALDDWAQLLPPDRRAKEAGYLLGVARRVDADGWRNQLRHVLASGEEKRLSELARQAPVDELSATTLALLGKSLLGAGMHPAAVELLTRAQRRFPADFWINHNLAWALTRVQPPRREEAVGFYRAAVALRPESPGVRQNLGLALENQGKLAEAIASYHDALRLQPGFAEAHCDLGHALTKQRKLDDAIASFREALRLKPDFPRTLIGLGIALKEQGKLDEAIACHQQAIRLRPDVAEAHHNLGFALKAQGKLDEAIASYQEAIRLRPDAPLPRYNLGIALAAQGKHDEAIASYQEALRLKPDFADAHGHLGNALRNQGNLAEAIASYREALRLEPDNAITQFNLGNAVKAQGKLDEAIAWYQASLRLKPDMAEARCNLGNALTEQGKLDEAIGSYEHALRLNSDLAPAHFNLGRTLARQGKWAEAIAHMQEAIRLKPNNAAARATLARELAKCPDSNLRNPQQAVEHARKAVELMPSDAGSWNALGVVHYRNGEWNAAIEALTKSIELAKGENAALNLFFLAMAHERLGDKKQTRAWYNQAVAWMDQYKPKDEELLRLRAEAAALLGVPEGPPPRGGPPAPPQDEH